MQWDKVKNILIAILLTINLFLLGNLAVRGWQSHRRTSELEDNLRTLVSARGMQLDTAFSFPEDITLPELSLDRSRADEEKIAAAMLGDHAEIGCGSVLNPGTVVGKNARVYPLSMVRGFVPANHIYKKAGEVAEIHD